MGKGIGAGLVSGGFVGAVVLTMLSLYAPLPQDRIDTAPKLNVETQEPETVTPEEDQSNAAPSVEGSTTVAASSENQSLTSVVTDSSAQANSAEVATQQETVAVIQPTAPDQSGGSSSDVDSPTAEIASTNARVPEVVTDTQVSEVSEGDSIVIASADTGATTAPQSQANAQAPVVQNVPSVEADTGSSSEAVQPSQLPSPTVTGTEKLADEESAVTSRGSKLPVITTPDVIETASADTPITLPQVNSGVVTNRLPSIGGTPEEPKADEVEDVAPSETESLADLGALRAFGTKVEGTEGKSLFGLVLIDSGENGIPRDDLMKLSVPVTIALDPTGPNAKQIMEDYRNAGIEVVAIANELPTASSPSDVAVAVEAYFAQLPQAVGIMDPLDGRIQSNRTLLQPVLGAIRSSGHGLITYDRGLNTAQQAARREDIPAATVFRVLDANLEEGPKIKRYLDRAAFNANRDGSVVVVGRSYPETVKAIVEWVLEKKEAGIAMVPVSAVMLANEAS